MTTYTAPAHLQLSARIAAAKAAARQVLDLAAAGADTAEARALAADEARLTLGRIASLIDALRADLDQAEHEAVAAFHMTAGASDAECRAAAGYSLRLEIEEA
ncbi:hypothetical protein CLBKND_04831 [Methylorubrum aminovorans]